LAGHLDGSETVLAAARRVAREEAGIALEPIAVVGVMHRRVADGERIDCFVAASSWTSSIQTRGPDKYDERRRAPIGGLPACAIPCIAAANAAWRHGMWFTCHGWNVDLQAV
jgi:8-oxo-dGTP pyrophosphatase MutT (NUDIX family)